MRRLVAAVPGAGDVLAEHLREHRELRPVALMADLRRWFTAAVAVGDGAAVVALARALESVASSPHDDVRSVVDVVFVEGLVVGADPVDRRALDALRPLAGPYLAASLAISEADA